MKYLAKVFKLRNMIIQFLISVFKEKKASKKWFLEQNSFDLDLNSSFDFGFNSSFDFGFKSSFDFGFNSSFDFGFNSSFDLSLNSSFDFGLNSSFDQSWQDRKSWIMIWKALNLKKLPNWSSKLKDWHLSHFQNIELRNRWMLLFYGMFFRRWEGA
jgi:hypothetical protein